MSIGNWAIKSIRKTSIGNEEIFREFHQRRIFLTGATGFFGTWLLAMFEILNEKGIAIHIIAASRKPEVFLEKESRFKDAPWLSWEKIDLTEIHRTENLKIRCDYIIHAAAETSPEALADPASLLWSTIDGWRSILAISKTAGCKRILLVSSGAVYGSIEARGATESDFARIDFSNPRNAYAMGKQACEQSAAAESKNSAFDILTARCFSFIGPGLPLDQGYAIGNFIRDAIAGNAIRIKSDGSAVRSYLHMSNLPVWLLTILLKGKGGEAYNVGSGKKVTIAELAHLVSDTLGRTFNVVIEGNPSTGIAPDTYYPQVNKARSLGLTESHDLKESILELAEFAGKAEPN